MPVLRQKVAFVIFFSLCFTVFFAQSTRISGRVTDQESGEALPFVTVGLKKQLIAVVTNDAGEFDLFVPETTNADTLVFNFFGYKRVLLPLPQTADPLKIQMQTAALEIEEVQVFPQKPEFYVKEAMRRISYNYAALPFVTVAYYREITTENDEFVQSDEGVFKTFYPNYLDTVKNQDQLMLYRRANSVRELAFMSRNRQKEEKKRARKDTAKKNGPGVNVGASTFGGPQDILKSSKLNSGAWSFLDTTKFSSYNFEFAPSSFFGGNKLLVISFKSRRTVNHLRENGLIYIDPRNFAIVKITDEGDFVVPVWIRPILFVAGFGVTDPVFSRSLEFREESGRWYPQNIRAKVDVKLTKRYWFAKNDRSHLHLEQVFMVNKLKVGNEGAIPLAKRYDHKKKMEEQVFNDEQLRWEEINQLRF